MKKYIAIMIILGAYVVPIFSAAPDLIGLESFYRDSRDMVENVLHTESRIHGIGGPDIAEAMLIVSQHAYAVNRFNTFGMTPLHVAAVNGNDTMVRALYAHGANLDTRSIYRGATALHMAAIGGHSSTMALLIEMGAKQYTDHFGRSPAFMASQPRIKVASRTDFD